ncbi:MAG: hypothetical protein FJW31_20820 [Acidobacteria bacterium]|nr:hypothetical protein [Acidobacteriota bacterium]
MDLFDGAPKPDSLKTSQVKTWVRERLALSEDAVVMVTELRCTEPGCPPLETVIAVLDGPGSKRQFKLHKGVAEVTPEDVAALDDRVS